jgi:hypothetical protein
MGQRLGPLDINPNRRTRALCVSLDPMMLQLLRRYCPPGSKHLGCFIGQLLMAHDAREEARREQDRNPPGDSPAGMDEDRMA